MVGKVGPLIQISPSFRPITKQPDRLIEPRQIEEVLPNGQFKVGEGHMLPIALKEASPLIRRPLAVRVR
jgi:hypothetical protein